MAKLDCTMDPVIDPEQASVIAVMLAGEWYGGGGGGRRRRRGGGGGGGGGVRLFL
jgi:hypothetical protein